MRITGRQLERRAPLLHGFQMLVLFARDLRFNSCIWNGRWQFAEPEQRLQSQFVRRALSPIERLE